MDALIYLLLLLVPDRQPLGPVSPEPVETIYGVWHKDNVTIHVGYDEHGNFRVLTVGDPKSGWSGDCCHHSGYLDVQFYCESPGPWVGRYWIKGGKLVGWYDLACRIDPLGEPFRPTFEEWTRTKE